MCDFCNDLKYKEIIIPMRTTLAEDNICKFVSPNEFNIDYDCSDCKGCADENNYFSITAQEDTISINYYHKIRDVIIAPISARLSFNYCPMCGKRISEKDNKLKFWWGEKYEDI